MITAGRHQRFTHRRPGPPISEWMHRYWQPIGRTSGPRDMTDTKMARLLGDDPVLHKARDGTHGPIESRCAHRGGTLLYSVPSSHTAGERYGGPEFPGSGEG
jgi:hypothetical protein